MGSINLGLESVWPPLPTLDDKKNEWIPKIDLYTSMKILDGFNFSITGINGATAEPVNGIFFFKYDADDQANFTAMSARALLVAQAFKMTDEEKKEAFGTVKTPALTDILTAWRGWAGDNALTILLNTPQFLELLEASGDHKEQTLALGWLIKDDLLSVTTEEELLAKVAEYDLEAKYRWAQEKAGL